MREFMTVRWQEKLMSCLISYCLSFQQHPFRALQDENGNPIRMMDRTPIY